MNGLKGLVACLTFVILLSAVTFATINSYWGLMNFLSSAGAVGVSAYAMWSTRCISSRDYRVRALIIDSFDADADIASLHDLAQVLNTPDIARARSEAIHRQETLLAQRYVNGDASDY